MIVFVCILEWSYENRRNKTYNSITLVDKIKINWIFFSSHTHSPTHTHAHALYGKTIGVKRKFIPSQFLVETRLSCLAIVSIDVEWSWYATQFTVRWIIILITLTSHSINCSVRVESGNEVSEWSVPCVSVYRRIVPAPVISLELSLDKFESFSTTLVRDKRLISTAI